MGCGRGLALTLALALSPGALLATNGMNMEGYGPIACAMGGASIAYDNGTAAVMNNPATLALAAPGSRRLDLAAGRLGPDVSASVHMPGGQMTALSAADAFYMPAFGTAITDGPLTYGLGVFAQGGMGTEFTSSSWLSDPSGGVLRSGLMNRSEVSIGRMLVPIAYEVTPALRVGATVDLVWAGLDLQMAMSEAQFVDLATTKGGGSASGTLANTFGSMYVPFGGTGIQKLHHAYFDFSNSSALTGQAKGLGLGAKLGVVYSVTPQLNVGATYHSQTRLGDLETDSATMRMGVNVDTGLLTTGMPNQQYADLDIPVSGQITIVDFQWPATLGAGVAYQATDDWLVVADVRRVNWSAVMENFTMVFDADAVPENGGFGGQQLEATLYQEWEDQTVLSVGSALRVNDRLTLRAGFNGASNPVPDSYLNALFPAIVENHVSFGGGYAINGRTSFEISVVRGFENEATNPGNGSTVPMVTSSHGQWNGQVMVSRWL